MNLSVGIVGLPNAGKSTLFNALLKRQQAKVSQHPFTTISPNTGAVSVPDERLERLSEVVEKDYARKPTMVPAKLKLVDIAGLIKGAHQGEGLGNEFLGHIREVDSILHVVRSFGTAQVSHPMGSVDPLRDMEVIETELILADLSLVERHLKTEKLPKQQPTLQKIYAQLEKGIPAAKIGLSQSERETLGYFPLITQKPIVTILNVSEADLASTPRQLGGKPVLPICAKLEAELTALSLSEQEAYLKSLGVSQQALEAVVVFSYHVLNLVTFYTITKGEKVSAWPILANTPVKKAAGKIHTRMEKGFIKADVINYSQLVGFGSWRKAVELGKVKTMGKDYLVQEGDVLEIRFSA